MQDTYGFPYFLIHRGDLHKVLLDKAREVGVVIRTNSLVSTVDQETPSITLEDGSTHRADLIIGADGTSGDTALISTKTDLHLRQ
jgi:salicylate hydroxylase